ncbi:MAG: DUF721 domain-containing protein [Desulfocapsa sp.]|nr:DUF721 domain-containing protein [Desulfocapsa sp.]
MKKKDSLFELGNVLPQLTRQRGWEEKLDLHSIFLRWQELLDSDITDHCRPVKIVKKILWVEVENSAWLQQLQFQTVLLLEILNKSLRISTLGGLRFCLEEREKDEKKNGPSLRYVQPPAKDVAAFERQVESISDKDVRESLVRFWYLSQACRRE